MRDISSREFKQKLKAARPGQIPGDLGGVIARALKTHAGRLLFIRTFREHIPPAELDDALAKMAEAGETHPVFWFFPELKGFMCCPRSELLRFLRKRKANPGLWDYLKQESHQPGTVFWFLSWGKANTYIRSLLVRGNPEDN
jgi:hypothetical protein